MNVPPGVLASSAVGDSGADIELDNLLGGFVAERTRRCDIIPPEGETTILGFDCVVLCFELFLPLELDVAGDGGLASVGVGGVTKVDGVSTRLGGVAGSVVTILFGAETGREGED
jgi:hypothetical protein